ncbi:MAG: bifunctional phosphopantothenoylcysteine decarboxylase/phosphopantothenate--cysteine ligase CoaBC [Candidatus Diapherotrites archaeon]|nr:bifunctional phosphopantothenoylcysteine decarboxylase/phosphopantothenate--cysteine ligase CoaBC [Candidatus Diapherotrites archaeon]
MHPSEAIRASASKSLYGKLIVLGVSSSIAAVKTVEIARELIRHGAEVQAVMSKGAEDIIAPGALEFATGKPVITHLSGMVEHVDLFGAHGKADLLLLCPASANVIGKIANGIADDALTTIAMTVVGVKKPVLVCPAMHLEMWQNTAVRVNVEKLGVLGAEFVPAKSLEGAEKIADKETIVLFVERALSGKRLAGKKVVVCAGATREEIDPVRVLTNKASGKTGEEIAKEAFRQGAQTTLIHNRDCFVSGIKCVQAQTIEEFRKAILSELEGADVFVSAAAIGDFVVEKAKDKLASEKGVELKFRPAPKILAEVVKKFPDLFVVAFKAETNKGTEELEKIAKEKLKELKQGFVVANDVAHGGMGTDENSVLIVGKNFSESVSGKKSLIARKIVEKIECGLP